MGTGARRSREQSRRHANHWAKQEAGALTYVALGDSAGVGVGVDDPQHSYVGVIANRLAKSTGQTIRTINLSVSGAKATDLRQHQLLKLAEVPAPDFVTCVIGGNDVAWARHFRVENFARDLTAIAQRLPKGTTIGLVPNFIHWPYEARATKANRIIRHAASQYGHRVADIHTATKELSFRGYMGTFAGDYFHPNATGHALWADAIWQQMTHEHHCAPGAGQ